MNLWHLVVVMGISKTVDLILFYAVQVTTLRHIAATLHLPGGRRRDSEGLGLRKDAD